MMAMSFWIPGRKAGGRRSLYSVSVCWTLIVMLIAMVAALVLPWFLR